MARETTRTEEEQRDAIGAAPGRLAIISGPSGVGKTALCLRLTEEWRCRRGVTATTRAPRQGERDGIDYHFYERDSFLEAAREGRFLEHAEVHGSFYGSPFTPLLEPLEEGATVLLSIDVQGAAQLLERRIPALFIFIEPPDMGELRRRLQGRGSDDPDSIDLRLENAREEMAQKGDYDHSVVNDDLGQALEEIASLLGLEPRR